jgi:hypothetical protein
MGVFVKLCQTRDITKDFIEHTLISAADEA